MLNSWWKENEEKRVMQQNKYIEESPIDTWSQIGRRAEKETKVFYFL